ncbi:MAG: DUF5131 family protein [Microbacteriaceae bacterium]
MGEETKIQWCDHTFNPWIGCAKVHTGCLNCYAEADMAIRRKRVVWGENGSRSVTSDAYWKQPHKWNREAQQDGVRRRVFCASLADVFEDRPELAARRDGLFEVIDATPWLDWLLLTKRPQNIVNMTPEIRRCPECADVVHDDESGQWKWCFSCKKAFPQYTKRKNVWLGTSVSDQATANKAVPELLKCRDLSPVLFLSCEPLIGPIDLTELDNKHFETFNCLTNRVTTSHGNSFTTSDLSKIDWCIVGGESGPQARVCKPRWINTIVKQCGSANVPVFVKQLGQNCITRNDSVGWEFDFPDNFPDDSDVEHDIHGFRENYQGADCRVRFSDKKGGNPEEWPPALRVRQFPKVAS